MADTELRTPSGKPRARALGIPFDGQPGPANAITDVPGVRVGTVTLIEGDGPLEVGAGPVRTGVTAILPRGQEGVGTPVAAGYHSLNGNGELTGMHWVAEAGQFSTPVLLTNTHAVGACHRGAIDWMVTHKPELRSGWLLPVVGETYDGYLNDIAGSHITPEHAVTAIDSAQDGPIEEGSVGGGTGMNCYAFKGGNGTASRRVAYGEREYTLGAFVQANFGIRHELTIAGRKVGRELGADNPMETSRAANAAATPTGTTPPPAGSGSVIVIIATDAPLLPGQCTALARRVPLGLARTGTTGSHFSGDIFLAFSTANEGALRSAFPAGAPSSDEFDTLRSIPAGRINPFYDAVVEAVEEAVVNALVANEEMTGRDGHRTPALPHEELVHTLRDQAVASARTV
ncbi:DmpA family aminopeptidase [Streptomyces endophyticus]|uniref:P1 family peptidase n=1 Tax=Streptomyces endophyticus TaxID=714166 RepID=A0ABU6FBV2_9ACTN|nr:P1 family peptidase [Streptomyces endophyticus]MEB8340272.1 P1 family peptidase [Streptomyces endophyticus]